MASSSSSRKKLDEYHLKILRELLTIPTNKYCFDCHQRGPTYVNVSIGSFVCTTCSGMLRGLTPPHRVKSVTMATFSPEEMETIKSRGNEYCRKVWLGLYDSELPSNDEQEVKDFMISKYEKKRYYLDPSTVNAINGCRTPSSLSSCSSSSHNSPLSHNISDTSSGKFSQQSSQSQQPRPNTLSTSVNNNRFIVDFESPSSSDPFNSSIASSTSEMSFANFDNNPVFVSPQVSSSVWPTCGNGYNKTFSGPDLLTPTSVDIKDLFRKPSATITVPSNRWSIPITNFNKEIKETPSEDKYAALKDLDCLMKSQLQEQNAKKLPTNGFNSELNGNSTIWPLFSSVTYGTTSEPATPFNPFGGNINQCVPHKSYDINPFHLKQDGWNNTDSWRLSNEYSSANHSQDLTPVVNGWLTNTGNPFKVNSWCQSNGQHHSSNPFL